VLDLIGFFCYSPTQAVSAGTGHSGAVCIHQPELPTTFSPGSSLRSLRRLSRKLRAILRAYFSVSVREERRLRKLAQLQVHIHRLSAAGPQDLDILLRELQGFGTRAAGSLTTR